MQTGRDCSRKICVAVTNVTFRWKDYAHHNKQRTITLTHEVFLRRFLEHVLPRGFPRIRYLGFLANRRRGVLLPLCRTLLAAISPLDIEHAEQPAVRQCPRCHAPMGILEFLTARQVRAEEARQVTVLDSS